MSEEAIARSLAESKNRASREIVARHHQYTGSTVAASLLGDWPRRCAAFTKVMPRDYRRVLDAMRVARAQGRNVDEAIMEASRG